ncbi:HdeD family acid-resistance protein [Actinomadura craniellae]|uniref:HdeD family acid-resistance protein n=1 Tax=Actinomadura craniellae TaxID=2231787 RepID=A0A365H335_9ACTN|nr:HdeD family acid-resistance protein [Actinomadura craniellae]RAY13402.1 HdeD family acid-resistance protein [Actinomadura craniellae]
MFDQLGRHWWVLALRGALAILFGLVAWIWPGITVLALVIVFGLYALVDGVFALVMAIRGGTRQSRPWLAVTGAAGVLLGVLALVWPGVTALVLLFLIAIWAVITGVFEIAAGIYLRQEITDEWLWILGGALSVLLGFLLFVWPVSGAIAVVWMIGFFSIVYGAVLLASAFRLRRLASTVGPAGPAG